MTVEDTLKIILSALLTELLGISKLLLENYGKSYDAGTGAFFLYAWGGINFSWLISPVLWCFLSECCFKFRFKHLRIDWQTIIWPLLKQRLGVCWGTQAPIIWISVIKSEREMLLDSSTTNTVFRQTDQAWLIQSSQLESDKVESNSDHSSKQEFR